MNNYYFTFGTAHRMIDGFPLQDHYVKVTAENSGVARCIFITLFAIPNLEKYDKWSSQYDEENFPKDKFMGGELTSYRQDAIKTQFQLIGE